MRICNAVASSMKSAKSTKWMVTSNAVSEVSMLASLRWKSGITMICWLHVLLR